MDTKKIDLCEQMAEASLVDAETFWSGAPLYSLERMEAAKVWRTAASNPDHPLLPPEEYATELARQADAAWELGDHVGAVVLRIQAQTWRRVVRILEGKEARP